MAHHRQSKHDADRDRFAEFISRTSNRSVERMGRRINYAHQGRAYSHPNRNRTNIEEHTIKVREKAFPEMNVIAVITFECRLDIIRTRCSK